MRLVSFLVIKALYVAHLGVNRWDFLNAWFSEGIIIES